jgi:hypothetical protein
MDKIKSNILGEHKLIEEGTHLPFPYVVELMKGIKNILTLNTD